MQVDMFTEIRLNDGRKVLADDYIEEKTKNLIEKYGYPTLTKEEVKDRIQKILNGESLNVIGMLMKDDIEIKD